MRVYVVTLTSEEYGAETFTYDTKSEARAGIKRLICKSKQCYATDSIVRQVEFQGDVTVIGE